MDISLIDKNMANNTTIEKDGFVFYNVDDAPMRLYGVMREGDVYTRVPAAVSERVSVNVASLSYNTAGGRVRFVTDSPRIAVIAHRNPIGFSDHMPYTLKAGLDLYADDDYQGTFRPGVDFSATCFESVVGLLSDRRDHTITINMPLYGGLRSLYVGIEKGATLSAAPDYRFEPPVVFYGSSITQGGCASRPGTSYEAVLSRALDMSYINLGFSGNAKGEDAIAEYIANLSMSAFVYDYDHNAPNVAHLAATHERMYKIIREKNPDLPIIMVSRPQNVARRDREERFEVIRQTYENAKARGERVWLVHGGHFFDGYGNDATVDGCHPTDLGFRLMANGILPTLREALLG